MTTAGPAALLTLDDLFAPEELERALQEKLVREQRSTDGGLSILNYTELAVYGRAWTDVTRACRGLVVERATGRVVARPWPKFFNHGERAGEGLDLTAPVEVTDKLDGSLGILHVGLDGRPAVATRGSFTSEQAVHATALYRERYDGAWRPADGVTHLFEIVYPGNRIVVDYGDQDDLVLLGGVRIATGALLGPREIVDADGWPGPVAHTFGHRTLAEALAAAPRPNSEGLVVRYLAGEHADTMVKIKQADYVTLHRLVTGMTARRLWERAAVWAVLAAAPATPHRRIAQVLHLDAAEIAAIAGTGPDWREQLERTAPEEFTDWITATVAALEEEVAGIRETVEAEARAWRGTERRDVAQAIARHPYRGLVFAALDGKPYEAQAWATIRPAAERPFRSISEEVA